MEKESFPSESVQVSELGEYIRHLNENDGFYNQFKNIPSGQRDVVTLGKQSYAQEKNRYRHIFPYDHSRVKLQQLGTSEESTYINACYIQHYNGTYIAAQGPMSNTMTDFWRMVWETDCPKIIMLANVMENGKVNCDQYWPNEGSENFGEITVTILEEDIKPQYTIRKFNISKKEELKEVHQFHFTGWIDLKVPDISTGLLDMRDHINSYQVHNRGPSVFHCRAGVGRTGTYLAIDYSLKQAQSEGYVDVVNCLYKLRACRMNMIETLPQWKYVYHTILESLYCNQCVSISYENYVQKVHNRKTSYQTAEVEQQFQVLDIINGGYIQEEKSSKILPENPDGIELHEDNIQVVHHIKGYKDHLLNTDMPGEKTVHSFWESVVENDVRSIVMLNSLKGNQWNYWPLNTEKLKLNMTKREEFIDDQFTVTDIIVHIKDNKDSCIVVKHCHFNNWENEEDFPEEEKLLELYKYVQKKTEGKILVHCLDGSIRSGIFCVLNYVLQKMIEEKEIDIFNAVKIIRQINLRFIPNKNQYNYLYKLVEAYIKCDS